jgi:hypothetical protein
MIKDLEPKLAEIEQLHTNKRLPHIIVFDKDNRVYINSA